MAVDHLIDEPMPLDPLEDWEAYLEALKAMPDSEGKDILRSRAEEAIGDLRKGKIPFTDIKRDQ